MLKVTLFLVAAAALGGCANTRRESAAAIQGELPQLVDACNGAFRDGREQGLGIVVSSQGIDACDRLAHGRSIDLVRPTTAELYRRYRVTRNDHAADRAGAAANVFPDQSQTWHDPAGAFGVAVQDAVATFPGSCSGAGPFAC